MLLRPNHTPYLPSNFTDEDTARLEKNANTLALIKSLLLNKRQINHLLKQPYWNGADASFDRKFIGCNMIQGDLLDFAQSAHRNILIDAIDEELSLFKTELAVKPVKVDKRQYTDKGLMHAFANLPSLSCLMTNKMGSEYRFDGQDIIGLSDLLRLGAYRLFYCQKSCPIGGAYGEFLSSQTPDFYMRGYPGDHVIDYCIIESKDTQYQSIGVRDDYSSTRIYDQIHYPELSTDGFTHVFTIQNSRTGAKQWAA